MNKNVVIVLTGGFLIALMVALLVNSSLHRSEAPPVAQEKAGASILVAARDLKTGEVLAEDAMIWRAWPETAVFPGSISRVGEAQKTTDGLSGRLIRDVAAGEPMGKAMVVPENQGNFLSAALAPGMRAVAVGVSAESMAGGFIGPGDYVDIMLTYSKTITPRGDDPDMQAIIDRNIEKFATETILQNVRVLAIDQASQRTDDKVKVAKTLTVEVNQRGAEILALAEAAGTLSLALRGLGDDAVLPRQYPVVTDERLTNVYDELYAEEVKLKGSAGSNGNIVRIYNGDTMREVVIH